MALTLTEIVQWREHSPHGCNSSWNFCFHRSGMGKRVLSGWHETRRLPHVLRHEVRHGGSRQHVLSNARSLNREGLGSQDTASGFIFALKVPQTITHEKVLLECEPDLKYFVETADHLGDKLGPMLLQFPYFNKMAFKSGADFLARLKSFLKYLPKDHTFSIEIRNKAWLTSEFADLLRSHNVALALQDQSWMPLPFQMNFDYLTADFTYVRLLGDRKGIEKQTKVWDKVIVDRSRELRNWVDVCEKTARRGATIFVYINNHFSGHGLRDGETVSRTVEFEMTDWPPTPLGVSTSEFDFEKYRARLRKMSEEELVKQGKMLRTLCSPGSEFRQASEGTVGEATKRSVVKNGKEGIQNK